MEAERKRRNRLEKAGEEKVARVGHGRRQKGRE